MNTLILSLMALAMLPFAALHLWLRSQKINHGLHFANIAEGTHRKGVTRKADAAITTRFLLGKVGSDGDHIAVSGVADLPVGVITDEAAAAEDLLNIALLAATDETVRMVASEAISDGEDVYTAASGKIQDEPATAGTYFKVGTARRAADADGDVIEVEPCVPIKLVVIAALTSTNGTAAGAADLAALKVEAEKIGDDVRAIGTALATPALVKVLA